MPTYHSSILFITLTSSNVLFSLTLLNGTVITRVTTGHFKVKGSKNITLLTLKQCLMFLNNSSSLDYCIHIKLKGVNKHKRLLTKLITKFLSFPILSFCDVTREPHNGIKFCKERRV